MQPVHAHAFARVGLLGNPSDAYGGACIAATVEGWSTRARVEPAERCTLELGAEELEGTFRDFVERFDPALPGPALALVRAALRTVGRYHPDWVADSISDPRARFRLRLETDVPRQAGLAGSSAIVVAALRALAAWFDWPLEPGELARLARLAETHELGIAAGPMDRVAQAFEGLLWMDFRTSPDAIPERLDPSELPPLYVAWAGGGRPSGDVHREVRERYERGDRAVHETMEALAAGAEAGRRALARRDADTLATLMDRNFALRSSLFSLEEADCELVATGRRLGPGVKLCGSGGAVVGILPPGTAPETVVDVFRSRGFEARAPVRIAGGAEA
ncbi:MAG: hypothetical protein MJE66_06500 [Proteobacteria bacterium]|nr:hypothetical protein [Pseudomonadota bacterium]